MGSAEKSRGGGLLPAKVREFLHGMAGHEMARMAVQQRARREHLLFLVTFGDLLGVPIVPSYFSRRLLPYVLPRLSLWKRYLLREKDLTDGAGNC